MVKGGDNMLSVLLQSVAGFAAGGVLLYVAYRVLKKAVLKIIIFFHCL